MAIALNVDLLTTALWPQGDIRDPLGVWGFRQGVTGDATGGEIKVIAQAAAGERAAYIYTVYSVLIAGLVIADASAAVASKMRILTNWPNIDTLTGVQAYGSAIYTLLRTAGIVTAPELIPEFPLVHPLDRFMLLFDPRPSGGDLEIIEMETININADTFSFEGYGYYWDRSVLNAPGGPRHPGSS